MAASIRMCFSRISFCNRIHSANIVTSSRCQRLTDHFKQAQEEKAKESRMRPIYRTNISEPGKHTLHQEGMFYTVPNDEMETFMMKSMSLEFQRYVKTFTECCVMVRRPAVEVIHYLKQMNYSLPPVRFVLYGRMGAGRSLSLAHILHYCALDKWMIVHCPWPSFWNNHYREILMSSYKPGRVDQPLEAIDWLKWFRKQNDHLIKQHDLKTTKTYVWSKREQTEAGSSFDTIIDHGINRAKYAADCVGVILRELKVQAKDNKFKTLVMVDGVNAFWGETKIKDENKNSVPVERLSLVHNFKKMIRNDWTNGAIITSVDQNAAPPHQKESCLPRYLLGKQGFEWLDPFVPIEVPEYNDKEIHSCLEYYIDRMWIQNPKGKTDEGKKELIFLSERNPLALSQVTAAW